MSVDGKASIGPSTRGSAATLEQVGIASDEAAVLPRSQNGPQPQRLLLTLLGDYWFGHEEHLPSAALVKVLSQFGSTSASSRAALSRLARRGLLLSSKKGRRTFYGLSKQASDVLIEGARRIFRFGAIERHQEGTWTFVAFSVPESERATRHALRTRLQWLGFAPLFDGLWVCPHPIAEEANEVLDAFGVESATTIAGNIESRPLGRHPMDAWDLDAIQDAYARFMERFRPIRRRVRAGDVGTAEALVLRTEIMNEWRNMPNLDPDLPEELLPVGWPREKARELFVEAYDGLGPLAQTRFRQILAEFSDELAPLATFHTSRFLVDS